METPNKKYNVTVSHVAYVKGNIEVTASSEEEASEMAIKMANNGDVIWDYDGVSDVFDPEVISVE